MPGVLRGTCLPPDMGGIGWRRMRSTGKLLPVGKELTFLGAMHIVLPDPNFSGEAPEGQSGQGTHPRECLC